MFQNLSNKFKKFKNITESKSQNKSYKNKFRKAF